jgi:hypothetical protein
MDIADRIYAELKANEALRIAVLLPRANELPALARRVPPTVRVFTPIANILGFRFDLVLYSIRAIDVPHATSWLEEARSFALAKDGRIEMVDD